MFAGQHGSRSTACSSQQRGSFHGDRSQIVRQHTLARAGPRGARPASATDGDLGGDLRFRVASPNVSAAGWLSLHMFKLLNVSIGTKTQSQN